MTRLYCAKPCGASWIGTPPHIEESNPIGAGDALVAGLVHALNLNAAWADVLRTGLASGAAAAPQAAV